MKNLNNYIIEKYKINKNIQIEPSIEIKVRDFIQNLTDLVSNITQYSIKVKQNNVDKREIQICFKKEDFMTNSPMFFRIDKIIEEEIENNLDKLKLKSCRCTGDGIRRKIYVYPEYK